jgi:hypothetical protein
MPFPIRVTRRHAPAGIIVALLATVAATSGCGGGDASGVLAPHRTVQEQAGAATDSALVGQWFRLDYFTDSAGVRTSETTWEFRGDGTATRSVVARSLSSGITSGVATDARWSTRGTTLDITLFPAGSTGAGGASGVGPGTVVGNPPFGGGTPAVDTTTATTSVSFAFRIDSTSTAGTRTLFLGELPFVFVGPPGTTTPPTTP